MIREPAFWHQTPRSPLATLLQPAAGIVTAISAWRMRRPGFRASVPVICCANASVGGSGKTTLALAILAELTQQGRHPAALLRGYGGKNRAAHRVEPSQDSAADTGDEALLLAQLAPTFTGGDRAQSARAAIAAGADCLVLDDGLQNPSLVKDLSILVIDGGQGFGNGCVMPAGPLREPIAAAAARCQAALLIGEDRTNAVDQLPKHLLLARAELVQIIPPGLKREQPLLAFAGIGRPAKFFDGLRQAGLSVAATQSFADHHRFSAAELNKLRQDAERLGAQLVCTPKDSVRLPPGFPAIAIGVALRFEPANGLQQILARLP